MEKQKTPVTFRSGMQRAQQKKPTDFSVGFCAKLIYRELWGLAEICIIAPHFLW